MDKYRLATELVILSENSLGFWMLSEEEMLTLLQYERGIETTKELLFEALKHVHISFEHRHQIAEIEEDFYEGF